MPTYTGNNGLFDSLDALVALNQDVSSDAVNSKTLADAILANLANYTQTLEFDAVFGGSGASLKSALDPDVQSTISQIAQNVIIYWVQQEQAYFTSSGISDAISELKSLMTGVDEASPLKTVQQLLTGVYCQTTSDHDEIALKGAPPIVSTLLTGDGLQGEHCYNEDIKVRVAAPNSSFDITGLSSVDTSAYNWPQGSGASVSVNETPGASGLLSDSGVAYSNWSQVQNGDAVTDLSASGKVAIVISTASGLPGDPLVSDWGTYTGAAPVWQLRIQGTGEGGQSYDIKSLEIPLAETAAATVLTAVQAMPGLTEASVSTTIPETFSNGALKKIIHDITIPSISDNATITIVTNVTPSTATLSQNTSTYENGGASTDSETKGFKEITISRRSSYASPLTKTYSGALSEAGGTSSDNPQEGGWTVTLSNTRNSDSVHLPLNLHHKWRLTRLQDNPRTADEDEVASPTLHSAMTAAQVEALVAPLWANYVAGSTSTRESTIGITKSVAANNDVSFFFPRSGLDDQTNYAFDTEFTISAFGTDEAVYTPLTANNGFAIRRVVTTAGTCDTLDQTSPVLNPTMTSVQLDAILRPLWGQTVSSSDCTRNTSLAPIIETFDNGAEIRIRFPNANWFQSVDSTVSIISYDDNTDNSATNLSTAVYPCGLGAIPGNESVAQACLPPVGTSGLKITGECNDTAANSSNDVKAPKFRQLITGLSARTMYMAHFWVYIKESTVTGHTYAQKINSQSIKLKLCDEAGAVLTNVAGDNCEMTVPLEAQTGVSVGSNSSTVNLPKYASGVWHSSAGPTPTTSSTSWITVDRTAISTPAILPDQVYLEISTDHCVHKDLTIILSDIFFGQGTSLYEGGPVILIPTGVGYNSRPDMEWTIKSENNWSTDDNSIQRWLYQWGITTANNGLPSKVTSADFN